MHLHLCFLDDAFCVPSGDSFQGEKFQEHLEEFLVLALPVQLVALDRHSQQDPAPRPWLYFLS
jgi:hypothetical protein